MKQIKRILKEVNRSLLQVDLFIITTKALLIFMIAYICLLIIGGPAMFGLFFAVIYFVSSLFVESNIDQVKKIEKYFPKLNEKLRTARDYKDRDSKVLDELEEDILVNLKSAELSRFIPEIWVLLMILLITTGVCGSLYIASNNLKILDFQDAMNKAIAQFNKKQVQNDTRTPENDFTSEESSIMQVGDERIEVEIKPVGMELDMNSVEDAKGYTFSTSFPSDVFISSGASLEEDFSEEQQMLIKRYFEKKKIG